MAKKSKAQRRLAFGHGQAEADVKMPLPTAGSSVAVDVLHGNEEAREGEPSTSLFPRTRSVLTRFPTASDPAPAQTSDGERPAAGAIGNDSRSAGKVHIVGIDPQRAHIALRAGGLYIFIYVLDAVKLALALLRKPVGFALFIFLLALLFTQVEHSFRKVISPFCWVPGISTTPICVAPARSNLSNAVTQQADFAKLAEVQGTGFEQLLVETAGNPVLSHGIMRAAASTRKLVTLVRTSGLKSKHLLADHLSSIVSDAEEVSDSLDSLNSRINAAVNKCAIYFSLVNNQSD